MRREKITKRKRTPRPLNCRLFVEGDELTVKIDLSQRHGLTKGTERRNKCKPGDYVLANHIVAQLFPPVHIPDGNGGYRPEILSLNCYVEEPFPKELTQDLLERMLDLIGHGEAPFTPQIVMEAVVDCLRGYTYKLLNLHADLKDDAEI